MLLRFVLVAVATISFAVLSMDACAQTSQRSQGLLACRTSCQQQGAAPTQCAHYCDCMQSELDAVFGGASLGAPITSFSQSDQQRIAQMMMTCSQRALGR